MSTFDFFLAIPIAYGAFQGFRKGLLLELVSLVALVLAILGGLKLLDTALHVIVHPPERRKLLLRVGHVGDDFHLIFKRRRLFGDERCLVCLNLENVVLDIRVRRRDLVIGGLRRVVLVEGDQAGGKAANLGELVSSAQEFELEYNEEHDAQEDQSLRAKLDAFLEQISLIADVDTSIDFLGRRCSMPVRCTIHSSEVSTILARSSLVITLAGR